MQGGAGEAHVGRADAAARAGEPDRAPRLTIAITGASGFIGRALAHSLAAAGHEVRPVSRSPSRAGARGIRWDPARGELDARALEGVDAVIHLAGESIGQRWTPAVKQRIRESRVRGTELLATTLARLTRPPQVLVSASAVGIYGDRGDEVLDEQSAPGTDFLARVALEWEHAADPARQAGIRVVHPRMGMVLSPGGGGLRRMLLPFRLGIGGPMGDGRQWLSWIALDDLVTFVHWLLPAGIAGPVNAVAPEPVRNAEFARTLGAVLRRPALLPVPRFALRLLFAEMADATLLAGQRVLPRRALEAGFTFRHATLRAALEHLLSGRR